MITVKSWTGKESKALRQALRLPVQDFAGQLGAHGKTVEHWERRGATPEATYQAALDTLLWRLKPPVAALFLRLCSESEGEPNVQYRESVLATATGLFDLAGDPEERTLAPIGRASAKGVTQVHKVVGAAMLLDDGHGATAAKPFIAEADVTARRMQAECPEPLKPVIMGLRAEIKGFAGCLAWDVGEMDLAARLYEQGHTLALDSGRTDLAAYILCHQAQLALWQSRLPLAIERIASAQSWASSISDFALRSYIAVRAAHVYAASGDRAQTLTCLDAARSEPFQATTPDRSLAYFHDPAMVSSIEAECMVLLGDLEAAVDAGRSALAALDPERSRDKALTALDIAAALVAMGDIGTGAEAAIQAVEATNECPSPRLVGKIREFRTRLTAYGKVPGLGELDDALEASPIVMA